MMKFIKQVLQTYAYSIMCTPFVRSFAKLAQLLYTKHCVTKNYKMLECAYTMIYVVYTYTKIKLKQQEHIYV